MKQLVAYGLLTAGLLTSAFAMRENVETFVLLEPASVGGTQLKEGSYEVRWKGNGPELTLEFRAKGKVRAMAAGCALPIAQPPEQSSILLDPNPDGTMSIAEMRFRDLRFAVVVLSRRKAAKSE
jgi:hypothetical protein